MNIKAPGGSCLPWSHRPQAAKVTAARSPPAASHGDYSSQRALPSQSPGPGPRCVLGVVVTPRHWSALSADRKEGLPRPRWRQAGLGVVVRPGVAALPEEDGGGEAGPAHTAGVPLGGGAGPPAGRSLGPAEQGPGRSGQPPGPWWDLSGVSGAKRRRPGPGQRPPGSLG